MKLINLFQPLMGGYWVYGRDISTKQSKILVTYLPPIAAKVTEFETIYQYLKYLLELSLATNMKYVNVTFDLGAAITVTN